MRADVLLAIDYYSYGSAMPGRSYNAASMTHGFNGQLRSPEVGADHYTALYWEYSAPAGRRWERDPRPNTAISPYAVLGNNPIFNTDPLGDTLSPPKGMAKDVFKRFDRISEIDPYFKVLYNELQKSKDINVKIEFDPSLKVGGIFSAKNSVLKFRNLDAIENDRSTTNEEIFHAYQTIFYGRNTMLSDKGGANLELEPRFLQAYKEYEANGSVNVKSYRFKSIPEIAPFVQNTNLSNEFPILYKLTYISIANKFREYWIRNNGPAKYQESPIYLGPDAATSVINKVHQKGEKATLAEDSEIPVIISSPRRKNK